VVVVLACCAAVGCDGAATDSAASPADVVSTGPDGGSTTPATAAPSTVTPSTGTPSTGTPSTGGTTVTTDDASIATVPDDGVPGIDSDDPFCRAWSEFAGSFQALALASAIATDPTAPARLEVIASGAVVAAAEALAEAFPTAVVAERDVFVDELIGPFARRAQRAARELTAAGVSDADVGALGDEWLGVLAETDVGEPDLVVVVGDRFDAVVDEAAAAFAAGVPPIPADPSLVTDAATPRTLGYIADTCPDQAILAGNDVIDD